MPLDEGAQRLVRGESQRKVGPFLQNMDLFLEATVNASEEFAPFILEPSQFHVDENGRQMDVYGSLDVGQEQPDVVLFDNPHFTAVSVEKDCKDSV